MKKQIVSYLVIFCLLPICNNIFALSIGNAERKQLFDFEWKFYLGDAPQAYNQNFDDSTWQKIDLPHDWSIEGKIDRKNPSGNDGGYFPTGIGWYRKTFSVSPDMRDNILSIYFEGVYNNSEVYINGKLLGIRPYGYSSFMYDLTPYIQFDKENTIAVRVDNSNQKNCRWYTGSGIYRHVWILATDKINIKHWGVSISTPTITPEESLVKIETVVKNQTNFSQNINLTTTIFNSNQKNTGSDTRQISLNANSETIVTQHISVKRPKLWSPKSPNLYQADISIYKENLLVDNFKQQFGIRSIQFDADKGFVLNGKPIILNGGCVHHDNGCLGATAYDRAEEKKVELLKAAGFNAVRTSHNIPSTAFLEACDRLGLLVIDEAFDGWKEQKNRYDYALYFDKWAVIDIQDMVARDKNHPSIILWSIGNEIIERKSTEAVTTAKMLRNAVLSIDSTRPITSAMTTWDNDWEIFDPLMAVHDVCGYNYQLHKAPKDHARVPDRVIVNTESYPANAFNIWKLVSKNNYIIGDFVWTAIDYLGESGIGGYYYPNEKADEHYNSERFPWHGAYCGDIDLTGWRKPISHYRNMLYNSDEKLYMAVREPNPENGKIKTTLWAVWPTWESWTWGKSLEGKNLDVEVYSKYPAVRLYLNNKLIAEKKVSEQEEFKATFTVPFTPGILRSTGIENGVEKESVILKTAQQASKIKLTADRKTIFATGEDLSFITVEITDETGIVDPNFNDMLHFEIEGAGKIIGIANADLKDTESYIGNSHKSWKGRAMVVVKSLQKTGNIRLKVASPNLRSSKITIKSIKTDKIRK